MACRARGGGGYASIIYVEQDNDRTRRLPVSIVPRRRTRQVVRMNRNRRPTGSDQTLPRARAFAVRPLRPSRRRRTVLREIQSNSSEVNMLTKLQSVYSIPATWVLAVRVSCSRPIISATISIHATPAHAGNIPSEIGALGDLQSLSLGGNRLVGGWS